MQKFAILLEDDDAATAVEYALVASLIAGAIFTTVWTLGTRVLELFESVRFP